MHGLHTPLTNVLFGVWHELQALLVFTNDEQGLQLELKFGYTTGA
jgi:hypothetical protein